MGCTYSKPNGRRDPNIPSFKVQNVDVEGVELNRGRIEIREGDLVFYQKGKDEIRWPLRWLRRYGYEQELFSFESGRRCATGNGIYAFKCSDAEALFNLVRDRIEIAGQDDQRAQHHQQQQQQQPRMINHGNSRMRAPQHPVTSAVQAANDSFHPPANTATSPNGSATNYVNESLLEMNADHEYINTGPPRSVSAAFPIDETAALVDFLHNPPSFGGRGGQTQLNYAEIETVEAAPASMENLLDETGLGAIHNVPRRGLADGRANRLSQPSIASGGGMRDSARFSMPNDLMAATAASAIPDSDSLLQTSDSDVFLDGVGTGGGDGSFVCSNYVNVSVDESAGSVPARSSVSGPAVRPPFNLILPPNAQTHEMNYANLAFDQQQNQAKPISEVNYILIDHNAQSTDNGGASAGGIGAGNSATSPMSPTSCMSLPDSPSWKTRSYAKIDFDKTQALSNTARAQDKEEGSRKTRHNSSIGDMP